MVDFIADYYKNIETYISGSPSDTFYVSKVRTVLEADVAAGLVPLYLCATDVACGSMWMLLTPTQMATHMCEKFLKSDPRFEIVVPRQYALVCFRVNPGNLVPGSHRVTEPKTARMGELNWPGLYDPNNCRWGIHAGICSGGHVVAAWSLIKEGADALLKGA
ncbi:hypothetical protein DKX38_030018 [Salix brachista]|uniref:Uncharacterized protein n=1 Tax=Salix brachista TaxID=2182728 RepID=A0A5N5J453_9ROSI|nr:hypothetical protein DKX38_030018 [Salix brachista]